LKETSARKERFVDELKEMYDPAHPGEVLKEHYLEPLGLSVSELAQALGVSRKHLSLLVNGRANVSTNLALRLSKALGTSVRLWLNMQQNYDIYQAKRSIDLSSVRVLDAPGRELV
jgi:addiction module HigA family antidote